MPKKYVHSKRGKTMTYGKDALEEAVKAVSSGMAIRVAAATFGIPKSTLGDRISGKHELHVKHGRPPAVPEEVETKLVNTVKMAAKMGVGLSRKQILLRTHVLCKRIKITPSYSNFHAGKDWWEGVKRRHPDLVVRKPEKLTTVRARMMNAEVVQKYFKDLTDIVQKLNISEHPQRIWNCDETGLNFEHTPVKVVAEKGERSVVCKTSTKSSNITIMACVNASGLSMPPMIIAKGKTNKCLHGFNTIEAPKGSMWAFQKNGWMSDDIGEKWFRDIFMMNCGPERPQLLILDGHSSHESLAIIETAMDENIYILALPPHCTHYLQPLDRSVFGPLKTVYNQDCSSFMQEHPLHIINKWSFPTLFRGAWEKTVTPANIRSGFQACGIVPLNANAVPGSAFAPSEPTDIAAHITTDNEPCEKQHACPGGNMMDTTVHTSELVCTDDTTPSIDFSLPILDLSDPFILSKFIDDINNEVATKEIADNETADNEKAASFEEAASPLFTVVADITPNCNVSVDECITSAFLPEKITDRPLSANKKKRGQTGHRLLTSEDILSQKRMLQVKKDEKENRAVKRSKKLNKMKI